MVTFPEKAQYLLKWETKAFAYLGLTLADGSPQVSPVWFDWDGTHIIINTARGRLKDGVLSRRTKVALAIPDPHDAYDYLHIKGSVVDETEVGGYEMICHLSLKYRGHPNYRMAPGMVRVTYKVLPEKTFTNIK